MTHSEQTRDVFICHAGADKDSVVRPLFQTLESAGVSCWLDEAEIAWGDDIVAAVNRGLAVSRFVVVVLSGNTLRQNWPTLELLTSLNTQIRTGDVKVLPLLVGDEAERETILSHWPLLAGKRYLTWPEGKDLVVQELSRRLDKRPLQADGLASAAERAQVPRSDSRRTPNRVAWVVRRLATGRLSLAIAFFFGGLVALIGGLTPWQHEQRHVLVMDSIVRRYDKSSSVTNAEEIVNIIQQLTPTLMLPFHLTTEHMLVKPNFENDDDVIEKAPALLIIHLSSFFGSDNNVIDPKELRTALDEFDRFASYVMKHSPTTHFLVYTREPPPSGVWKPEIHRLVQVALDQEVEFVKKRRERMDLIELPWDATFHDSQIVLRLKDKLRDILPGL